MSHAELYDVEDWLDARRDHTERQLLEESIGPTSLCRFMIDSIGNTLSLAGDTSMEILQELKKCYSHRKLSRVSYG